MPSHGFVGEDLSGDEHSSSPSESPDDDYDVENVSPRVPVEEEQEPQFPLDEEDLEGMVVIKWSIPNFDMQQSRMYSEAEVLNGDKWRILCFPLGNQQNYNPSSMSVFVDFADAKELDKAGQKWHRYVWFCLCLRSHVPGRTMYNTAYHKYVAQSPDWGFSSFVSLAHLYNAASGFLGEKCTITLEAKVYVCKGLSSIWAGTEPQYNSKEATGYVGLKNQGATCYMNSMLQVLYFTTRLRKAVYRLPTTQERGHSEVTLALQRVFYNLWTANEAEGTEHLTKAFGWCSSEAFMQHDVQEFNRVLIDNLETKMKGTEVEGTISELLRGTMKSYIKCMDVDYESSRTEPFYDIQLNVKGMADLYKSFDDYISEETLDGDNKYMAEGHGLQRARKGVRFQHLPPVLHLQLKRFEYDCEADSMVKVNSKFEFDEEIDLSRYVEEPEEKPMTYVLQAVLVHAGDIHGGHYTAFLRPGCEKSWFKFDDDRVTKATKKEAMDNNYGCEEKTSAGLAPSHQRGRGYLPWQAGDRRHTNAYMLVYVQKSKLDVVLPPVGENGDIPKDLAERFQKEKEELRLRASKLEEEDYRVTVAVQVVTEDVLRANHGADLISKDFLRGPWNSAALGNENEAEDLADGCVHPLRKRVRRHVTWEQFKASIENEIDIPGSKQRYWQIVGRQNGTMRPNKPVSLDEHESVGSLQPGPDTVSLYVDNAQHSTVVVGHDVPNTLLFVKYYSPDTGSLTYAGHLLADRSVEMKALHSTMCQLIGLDDNAALAVYEEVKPDRIDFWPNEVTLEQAQLTTGDILVVQTWRPVHDVLNEQRVAELRKNNIGTGGEGGEGDRQVVGIADERAMVGQEEKAKGDSKPKGEKRETMDVDEKERETRSESSEEKEAEKETDREEQTLQHPETVADYYAAVVSLETVALRRYSTDMAVYGSTVKKLSFPRDTTYGQLLALITQAIPEEAATVRLYLQDRFGPPAPSTTPLRCPNDATAALTVLGPYYSSVLYYEPLTQAQADQAAKLCVSAVFRSETGTEVSTSVYLEPNATGDDLMAMVLDELAPDVEATPDTVIVEEIKGGVIVQKLNNEAPLSIQISPDTIARVHQLPPEILAFMRNLPNDEAVLEVRHVQRIPFQSFGSPFYFLLKRDERYDVTRPRLLAAAGVKGNDALKWRVAICEDNRVLARVEGPDDVLFDMYCPFSNGSPWLALERPGNGGRVGGFVEKPVQIYN